MMRWLVHLFIALGTLVTVGLAVLAGTIYTLVWLKLPSPDALTDYPPVVKIGSVPAVFKQALLAAAEDEHFYTRQVVRNFHLTPGKALKPDKALNRHLSEFLLAFKIERELSKDQILELYINQTYLGQHAYGFEAAARTYFGKPLVEISLAEAAMLAGLPHAPATANPVTNPVRAKKRQKYVLGRMVRAGFISEEQSRQAEEEALLINPATRESVVLPVHAE
jgi:penicillin-binding protein 1A